MVNKKILIPIPSYGFDPSEVSIPWKLLSAENIEVVFATPNGKKATADILMLKGKRLGIWKPVLKARQDAVDAYYELEKSEAFLSPISYTAINTSEYDALFLPGGHDKGVKEYLESDILKNVVVDFFKNQKPVGAICHGVVLAARSIDPQTNKSVIYSYKTTSLLKSQEMLAYNLTRLWLKDYYLTYPEITVEDEVIAALKVATNYLKGPKPMFRDSAEKLDRGFVVEDRNYVSARWPGDLYRFSDSLIRLIKKDE